MQAIIAHSPAIATTATLSTTSMGGTVDPGLNQNCDEAALARGPNRRCIATGEIRAKSQLLRFVLGPDGALTFDANGKLPGRGMWLTPSVSAFTLAKKKNGFSRAARKPIAMPQDLAGRVAVVLKTQVLNKLGLARRGGQLELGTAKVDAAFSAGKLKALWIAEDTSAETIAQWESKIARANLARLRVVKALDQRDLAVALGRATVAVMGLMPLANSKFDPACSPFKDDEAAEVPCLGAGWQPLHLALQHFMNLRAELAPDPD